MRFVFHGVDHADRSEVRAAAREAHVAYQHGRGNPVGGPLLDAQGRPCGTLIVLEAVDLDAANEVMAADPYVRAGLFAVTSLHRFHAVDWPDGATD